MPDFFNYCPQCASQNISKDSRKFFECPDCNFVYFHNPGAATAIILEQGGKILFAVRKLDPDKGMLDLPGGFLDYHESAEAAIRREVKEELNIDLGDIRYLGSFPNQYRYKGIVYHTSDFIYTGHLDDTANIKVADDVEDIVWLPAEKVPLEKIAFASIRNAIEKYLKEKQ
jgi:NAD+ diphosphatase